MVLAIPDQPVLDTLLRLLPAVLLSVHVHSDQGVDKSQLNQLTASLPQILEKLRQAEPEKLEALVAEITQAVPGLEDVLPKQERRKRG